MDATAPDDKIQAVVGLVLQAVDQRLAGVRDQLVQITTSIARNHAELSRRIEECERLAATVDTGGAAATGQLVAAANTLTERVHFLESRVNQYTDERIAELSALIEQISPVGPSVGPAVTPSPAPQPAAARVQPVVQPVVHPVVAPVVVPAAAPAVAPAVARLSPLGAAAPAPAPAPAPARAAVAPAPTVAPTPAAAAVAPAPAVAVSPAPVATDQTIDIAALSAQMSERLAAAVDRALGAMSPAPGVSSSS